jgi:hypothetical protein
MELLDSLEYPSYNAELLRSKGLIITEDTDLGLALVRYHKSDNRWKNDQYGECNREDSNVQKHRSVVYSLESKCVIHASPPRRKSENAVVINSLVSDNWVATEYIDGTMISLFWSPVTNEWIMSSRSKFHAAGNFMSPFPFRDLFKEAIPNSLTLGDFLLNFDKDYTYTFILCHPEHKHVIEAKEPKIYLVQLGKYIPVRTGTDEDIITKSKVMGYDTVKEVADRLSVHCPPRITHTSNESLKDICRETMSSEIPRGIVLTPSGCNPCFERIRILSQAYEHCLKLRGSSPSIQTNIIRIWAEDPTGSLLQDYERFYKSEREMVHNVVRTLNESANDLILYYKNRHVRKSMEHTDLPHWSRRPIWDLHGIYLRERIPVNKERVLEYYRTLPASFVNRILKNREKENRRESQIANLSENTRDE